MKKLFYVFLVLLFIFPLLVNAKDKYSKNETWIECIYNVDNSATFSYYYNSTNAVFEPETKSLVTRLSVVSNLKSSNFFDNNTGNLYCPDIYVVTKSSNAGATKTAYSTKVDDAILYKASSEKKNVSGNNNNNNSIKKEVCSYGNVSFTLDITSKKVLNAEIPNYTITSFEHTFSDLYDINKNKCKCVKVKAECESRAGNYCSISKTGEEVCYDGYKEEIIPPSNEPENNEDAGSTNEHSGFAFCSEEGVLRTFQLVGYAILVIKILVPLLLIIFGSIDMAKAMMGGDEKAIKSATSMLVVRAVGGIIIFFIPTIFNFAVTLISNWSTTASEFQNCSDCIAEPDNCANTMRNACKTPCTWNSSNAVNRCECPQ